MHAAMFKFFHKPRWYVYHTMQSTATHCHVSFTSAYILSLSTGPFDESSMPVSR